MNFRLLVLALVVLSSCEKSKPVLAPVPNRLADRVRLMLARELPGARITVPDDASVVVQYHGQSTYFAVADLEQPCRVETSCVELIKRRVAQIIALQDAGTDAAAPIDLTKLTLMLRDTATLTAIEAELKTRYPDTWTGLAPLRDELPEGLSLVYVVNTPTGANVVQQRELAAAGLDRAGAAALARRPLLAATPKLDVAHVSKGVWTNQSVAKSEEGEALTWLALPELFRPLADEAKGELILALPSRSRFYAAAAKNKMAVEAMEQLARTANPPGTQPLLTTRLRWSPEGWKSAAAKP